MHLNMKSYVVGSTLLATAVISYIYQTRGQFYPTAVYLVSSKGCLMVIGNMALVGTLIFGQIIIKLFLGALREQELEHLNDRVSATIMDTLLAMTIFREEFDFKFIAFFVLLLSSKIFHWVIQDRVDYISHTPALGRIAYIRVFSLMFSLMMFNLSMIYYAATVTLVKGPSVMLLFGFEYAVLLATCLQSFCKFFVYLEDMRRDGRWDNKGAYLLYLDFITDMFKLTVYLIFFTSVMIYYGMPIHIVRQMYLTFNSFRARVTEVIQYRKATSNMNQRFPDATPDELSHTDGVCIVCREEMTTGKRLPCGHILHFQCLRSWLERQQTCPTCRASVLVENLPAHQQPQPQQPPLPPQQNIPNLFPFPNAQDGAPVGWHPFFPPNQHMFAFPPNNNFNNNNNLNNNLNNNIFNNNNLDNNNLNNNNLNNNNLNNNNLNNNNLNNNNLNNNNINNNNINNNNNLNNNNNPNNNNNSSSSSNNGDNNTSNNSQPGVQLRVPFHAIATQHPQATPQGVDAQQYFIQRVELMQQYLVLFQNELLVLHQALTQAQNIPATINNVNTSNASNSNSNTNNNNNNNSNSSNNNTPKPATTSMSEEDMLVDQAIRESAQAYEETMKHKHKERISTSPPPSPSPLTAPLSPTSPGGGGGGGVGEGEDRDSIRQRRLARFNNQ